MSLAPANAAPAPLFVGIDVGTSGCRACAIDSTGKLAGEHHTAMAPAAADGPRRRQDPQLWWTRLTLTLDALFQQIAARRVRALAVDGTSASLLLTDAAGRPLAPALMYHDRSSTAAAQAIAGVAPAHSAVHGPSSSLAKLLQLAPQHPHAVHALHQADWLSGRLCGRYGYSDENNALKLGYDPIERRWPAWLASLPTPRAWLPEVYPPGTVVGAVAAPWRDRWGLAADACVVTGTTDSTAAVLATGAGRPGDAVTCLGSTLVVKVIAPQPVFAPAHGVYSHRLDDLWLVGGASNSGGAVLRQFFTDAELARLTDQLQPEHATGLDYYPLPGTGERFPVLDPELRPRMTPRPAADAVFLQGLLEGMAAIEARAYALLKDLGAPYPRTVLSTGGGSVNPAWTRLRARALGVPVYRAAQQEAAYGAALLARRPWQSGAPPTDA